MNESKPNHNFGEDLEFKTIFHVFIKDNLSGEVEQFECSGYHITTDNELVCTIKPE